MKGLRMAAIGLGTLLATGADAAEIKVVSSVGMKLALVELVPQFEKATGHKVNLVTGTAVPLSRQIEAGDLTFDVLVLTPGMIDTFTKSGKVAGGTQTDVAKIGIGVAARAGAIKPDISNVDALKRALLNAKGIAYSKEGLSGTAMARTVEKLGLTDQLKDKTVLETRSGQVAANVVEGKAELAFTLISEILPMPGAQLVGPLPAEIQTYVVFASGISAAAADRAAASKAFVDFVKSPAALPALKAAGMEPG